nr:uncharacterized protein LOC125627972 isoform X2 [Caretta caretta]
MLALALLALPLLAPGAAPCLRCWPDAARHVRYDVRLLLGAARPGAAAGLEGGLSALLLGGDPGVRIMERERLEREAGKLFYRLDQIITRNRQVCSASCGRPEPFDLSECDSCQRLQARCRDQRVCAGAAVILAVGLSLVGLVLGAAVGAFLCYRRRARLAGGTEAEKGLAAGRTEPPAELGNGAPMEQGDRAPADLGNGAPAEQGDGAPTDLRNGTRMEPGDGAPADLGNGTPAEQGDRAPAESGDGVPMDLGNGTPMEQGDGTH